MMGNSPDGEHPGAEGTGGRARAERPAAGSLVGGLFLFLAAIGFETVIGALDTPLVLRLLAPVLVLLGVLTVARSGSSFHRDRLHDARWKLWTAWAGTATLVLIHLWLTSWTSLQDGFGLTFLTAACLTAAATIALRTVLTPRPGLPTALSTLAFLLLGVAALLLGIDKLAGGEQLDGVALLLLGVAPLVFGIDELAGGGRLGGVALLVCGVAFLLFGVEGLAGGGRLDGAAFLLCGVAVLLGGVARLGGGSRLKAVAVLLGSVTFLLFGVEALGDGERLGGVAFLLCSAAGLLSVVAWWGGAERLSSVALLLLGVALLLSGVDLMAGGKRLGGVATLLFGAAVLLYGVAWLGGDQRARNLPRRVLAYLRAPIRTGNDPER